MKLKNKSFFFPSGFLIGQVGINALFFVVNKGKLVVNFVQS